MQRDLAIELASLTGLETVSFRNFDCIVLSRGEVLKLFTPRSKRLLLGSPSDRRIFGDILVVETASLKALRPPSKRFEDPDIIVGAPSANFSGLDAYSSGGQFEEVRDLFDNLSKLCALLPNDVDGWKENFGKTFLEKPILERMGLFIDFLRNNTNFRRPIPDGMGFSITIEEP